MQINKSFKLFKKIIQSFLGLVWILALLVCAWGSFWKGSMTPKRLVFRERILEWPKFKLPSQKNGRFFQFFWHLKNLEFNQFGRKFEQTECFISCREKKSLQNIFIGDGLTFEINHSELPSRSWKIWARGCSNALKKVHTSWSGGCGFISSQLMDNPL